MASDFPIGSGGMPDLGALMQQAQKMQDELRRTQEQLTKKTAEASSGGGMVTVVLNGAKDLVSLRIDPQVIDPKDPQMLQDLIIAAVNQGMQKIREMEEAEMRRAASEMGVPQGMF